MPGATGDKAKQGVKRISPHTLGLYTTTCHKQEGGGGLFPLFHPVFPGQSHFFARIGNELENENLKSDSDSENYLKILITSTHLAWSYERKVIYTTVQQQSRGLQWDWAQGGRSHWQAVHPC